MKKLTSVLLALALALSLLGVVVFGLGGVFYTYIEQFSYGL